VNIPGGAPLNPYAKRIIRVFAEAYPGSAQMRGGRKLRKGSWEKVFPEITGDVSAKEEFLRGVEALAARGVLSVKWKRFREGDEAEALYLEDPEALYREAEVRDPGEIRREMLAAVGSWRPKTETGAAVREALTAKLDVYHDIFVSSPEDLRDLCTLFDLSPEEVRGRTIRALSVSLFSGSKRIEALLPRADKIGRSVVGTGLSELLGISRNYPEASCCLCGRLLFSSSDGIWEMNYTGLTLPLDTIEKLDRVEARGSTWKRILTVENKESYYTAAYALKDFFGGFVYTGGYPNTAVKALLKVLAVSGYSIFHFGDLDPEGISIFLEVERRAGIDIHPFLMSADIYNAYAGYGYELGVPALAKLRAAPDPRFAKLAALMTETRRGVEQEIIDIPRYSSGIFP